MKILLAVNSACWEILHFFFVVCWFFFLELTFSKYSFMHMIIIPVSESLDSDQAWHFVEPGLSSNCLQRWSADKELRLLWYRCNWWNLHGLLTSHFGMLSIDKGENSTKVPVFVIISLHQSRCVLVNSCAQAKIKISFGSPYLTDQALNLSYNFKTSFLS